MVSNMDCLHGDDLAYYRDYVHNLNDLEFCKAKCNADENCGAYVFHKYGCVLKKKTCKNNMVNKDDVYIFLKEEF